jgi:hypothetical protein
MKKIETLAEAHRIELVAVATLQVDFSRSNFAIEEIQHRRKGGVMARLV